MRRFVIPIVALVTALAIPAVAQAHPTVITVTTPGFWPACAEVTGSKIIMNNHHPVAVLHNKVLVCYGKLGNFQDKIHQKDPPRLLHAHWVIYPGSRHWRKGTFAIPGHPPGLFVIAKAEFCNPINGVCKPARVRMNIFAGNTLHPKAKAFYGNGS
jgi:hypothetical protein